MSRLVAAKQVDLERLEIKQTYEISDALIHAINRI